MGSTLVNVVLLVVALILGIGITYFGTSLLHGISMQTKIIIAIVLSVFAFIALYFMTRNRG
jgi:hypothetical protein